MAAKKGSQSGSTGKIAKPAKSSKGVPQPEHPKALIDLWIDELLFVFEQTERRYRRAIDRGAPREAAFRKLLSDFLPRKAGVAAGHVIAGTPAWSQQCDIILYNRLEAPVFSRDEGHQGAVLPVEAVYGVIEVKSVLTLKELKKATGSIQTFKRLCGSVHVGAHRLSDRFCAIIAYRVPGESLAEKDAHVEKLVAHLRTIPLDERPDDILVLGEQTQRSIRGSYLVSLIPQGSPNGTLDYWTTRDGRKNLQILLLRLVDERLRRVRTGMPDNHIPYLFEEGKDVFTQPAGDEKAQRKIGALPVNTAAAAVLQKKALPHTTCEICGQKAFIGYADPYYLISARDFHFGGLGAPFVSVAVFECLGCGLVRLFSTKRLDLTS